jgi:hypothetical protein
MTGGRVEATGCWQTGIGRWKSPAAIRHPSARAANELRSMLHRHARSRTWRATMGGEKNQKAKIVFGRDHPRINGLDTPPFCFGLHLMALPRFPD